MTAQTTIQHDTHFPLGALKLPAGADIVSASDLATVFLSVQEQSDVDISLCGAMHRNAQMNTHQIGRHEQCHLSLCQSGVGATTYIALRAICQWLIDKAMPVFIVETKTEACRIRDAVSHVWAAMDLVLSHLDVQMEHGFSTFSDFWSSALVVKLDKAGPKVILKGEIDDVQSTDDRIRWHDRSNCYAVFVDDSHGGHLTVDSLAWLASIKAASATANRHLQFIFTVQRLRSL